MTSRDPREGRLVIISYWSQNADMTHLLVKFNILHHFESKGKVSYMHMHAQQTDNAEITKHSVQRPLTIFTNNFTDKD